MQIVKLPAKRLLSFIALPLAGASITLALFSPGPVASTLLLTFALVLFALQGCRARRKVDRLKRDVALLEKAEGLAGYGRWCIEFEPPRHLWSEEMCHLAGLPSGTTPRDDILERIFPEGMQQIETVLTSHATDLEAFAIEFEVQDRDKTVHILRARARNMFGSEGRRERVFMVVRDVSADYALQRDRDEAIERAERAQEQANTDDLTGLANRRSAMARLDRAIVEARENGEPLSIIVFDIDNFKSINDRFGHPVGDKVIARLATIARSQARAMDLVGRIGGEEFIWLMRGCDSNAALDAAERLRWAVEAGTHSAPIPSITISAGHAQMEECDGSLLLFARADAALYEAKRNGRNRVVQAA